MRHVDDNHSGAGEIYFRTWRREAMVGRWSFAVVVEIADVFLSMETHLRLVSSVYGKIGLCWRGCSCSK